MGGKVYHLYYFAFSTLGLHPQLHNRKPGLASTGGIKNHCFTYLKLKYLHQFLFVLQIE